MCQPPAPLAEAVVDQLPPVALPAVAVENLVPFLRGKHRAAGERLRGATHDRRRHSGSETAC